MRIQKLLQTLAIGSLLFSSVAVLAADESTKQTANRESSGPFVFDLSFPGGTVPDFVAHVEKALDRSTSLGAKPNLIVPSEAGSLKLPKLELRSVDMDTLMNAASTLLGPKHTWQRAGPSTWLLYTRPDSRNTQAFFVGHLLKKFKIEDLTTAIETVWEMGSTAKADLKYHKDTQLLIIRADKAQLDSALNVLNQLRDALALDTPGDQSQNASKKR